MTDDTARLTSGNTDPHTVALNPDREAATLTLEAPTDDDGAEWFLHGGTTPFYAGDTATVFIDGNAGVVVAGWGETLATDEIDGEFVVGVVWYESTDSETVERDATRTLALD